MTRLTDKEKNYLTAVINPFKDRVITITKYEMLFDETKAFIAIKYSETNTEGEDGLYFPSFDKEKLYVGMVEGERYTIDDLGL